MKRTSRIIIATLLGILAFFTTIILIGLILTVACVFLAKIRIFEILLYSPIGSLILPHAVYVPAFFCAHYVIEKTGKNNYLPFLIVGIMILTVYIPSGIITLLANDTLWADLYGIAGGIFFIRHAMELKKQ